MIKSERQRLPGDIGHRGFTLIEILIALVLLGISIAVLAQLFSTNLRNISKSQNYVPAIAVAEAKMNEIVANDYLDDNKTLIKTEDGYIIEVVISEIMKDKFQNLPVKLMEIALTVRWQTDQKEKRYSLKSCKTVRRSAVPEVPEPPENKDEEQSSENQ